MKPTHFIKILQANRINCFAGVPDSLLKEFCKEISSEELDNLITANEGSAVAYAAGHYLATGKLACVYMQNSGQGNAINPLVSLADPAVYSIPMVILIGWRGQPGVKDEPQHIKQGQISCDLQNTIGVKTEILNSKTQAQDIQDLITFAIENSQPIAFLVPKNWFEKSEVSFTAKNNFSLFRENVIKKIANIFRDSAIVSTTGKISRELYEIRNQLDQSHESDFLTVGSMGHASMIGLGISQAKPNQQTLIIDGDGAVLMHMGSLAIIGQSDCRNLKHIVLNNSAHESVGAQPTVADKVNLTQIARACGYHTISRVTSSNDLDKKLIELSQTQGPAFLEICVSLKSRSDLGRPKESPIENKKLFINYLYTKKG